MIKKGIQPYAEDLVSLGFERWAGKYILDKEHGKLSNYFDYLYLIYNYWYREVENKILCKREVKQILEQTVQKFELQAKIFLTTNFDMLMDNFHLNHFLSVEHLHGRFVSPYTQYDQVKAFDINKKNFMYKYLYGTSVLKKVAH